MKGKTLTLLFVVSLLLLIQVVSAQTITANINPAGTVYTNETLNFTCDLDGLTEDLRYGNFSAILKRNNVNYKFYYNHEWQTNNSIKSGLPATCSNCYAKPKAFWYDDELFLIIASSGANGGYKWNGTTWETNTTMLNGLPTFATHEDNDVFWLEDEFYMITGSYSAGFNRGHKWNNVSKTWESNSTILTGLPTTGTEVQYSPAVFWLDGELYLLAGTRASGLRFGWKWNVTEQKWDSNSFIWTGLPSNSVGISPSSIEIYEYENKLFYIIGATGGINQAYEWTGSSWITSPIRNNLPTGLNSNFGASSPTIFFLEGQKYLLAGHAQYPISLAYQFNSSLYNENGTKEIYVEPSSATLKSQFFELECYLYDNVSKSNVTISNHLPVIDNFNLSENKFNLSFDDFDADYFLFNFKFNNSEGVFYNNKTVIDVAFDEFFRTYNDNKVGLTTPTYITPHPFWINNELFLLISGINSGGVGGYKYNFETNDWSFNSSVNSGLHTGSAYYYYPSVFNYEDEHYLIFGTRIHQLRHNYRWDKTTNLWVIDTKFANGLPTTSGEYKPTVFWLDDELYMVVGLARSYLGFKWDKDNEIWNSDTDIITGLPSTGFDFFYAPQTFWLDDELYMISSRVNYRMLNGYKWDGSSWVANNINRNSLAVVSGVAARGTHGVYIINNNINAFADIAASTSYFVSLRKYSNTKNYLNEDLLFNHLINVGRHSYKGLTTDVQVQVYDFEGYGEWSDVQSFSFPNRLPTSEASIGNEAGYYIVDLAGVCEVDDLDLADDSFDVYYKWFKDGVEFSDGSVLGLSRGVHNVVNLSSLNTSYNDTWVFSCRATDGDDYGVWSNSSSLHLVVNSVLYSDVSPKDNELLDRQLEANLTVKLNSTFNEEDVDVHFYWENDTLITSFSNVSVGDQISFLTGGLTPNQLYCWYAAATYNSVEFEQTELFCFRPNNEPKFLNLRIEDTSADNFTVMWDNELDMEWASFRIGSDIMEVRHTTGVSNEWFVNRIIPNKEYIFEFQSADDTLLAMSDYYNFMFRTFGWNPDLLDWGYKRVLSVDKDVVGVDQNDVAVEIILTEENFQTCGPNWWDPCYPGFVNLNYTDGSDLRFLDYYDYDVLRHEIISWNVPGQGGLSYTTIPDETSGDGDWIDYDNAHDDDWSSNAIPYPYGIDYFNYTIPLGAKTNSYFRIYAGEWGWDFELPVDCWGGSKLRFKTTANYTGADIQTYCQNNTDDSWINIWGAESRLVYETMMTWFYEAEVKIKVMPNKFDDDSQIYVEGVDGDYDVKFQMYYGNPDAVSTNSTLSESDLILGAVSLGEEIPWVVGEPIISEVNDTEGKTETGINVSWQVDQAVDNRIRYATNPYLLDSVWASRIINRTEIISGQIGNAERRVQLDVLSEDYLGTVSVVCSNASYNDNYTVNTSISPVELILPNLGTSESLTWTITYTENKTRYRNTNYADFKIEGLEPNTTYYYEINAEGLIDTTTYEGSFTLGTPPTTPQASHYNYTENRPDQQTTLCFEITNLNLNTQLNFTIQYWNTTSTTFQETNTTQNAELGVYCKTINVSYGDTWSYRAKLEGNTTGYSQSYTNLFMAPQEFFAGSYVTDDDDNLHRQYCPPDAEGYVNLSATCYEQTGYREGSHRLEDWIWIETNITEGMAPYKVVWWDGTSWTSHVMSVASEFQYLRLDGLTDEWQTFYVTDDNDVLLLNWTKPSMHHPSGKNRMDESKYVAFGITPTNMSYQQFYMRPQPYMNTTSFNWCQDAPGGNLYDCMSSTYWGTEGMSPEMGGTKYDRGQTFRGAIWNGDVYDTGSLNYETPSDRQNSFVQTNYDWTNSTESRFCFSFTITFFDESIYAENNITNYYFRLWQEDQHWSSYLGITQDVTWDYIGLFKWEYDPRTYVRDWKTQEDTKLFDENITRVINGTDIFGGYNKSLIVGFKDGFDFDLNGYEIYESGIQTDGQWNNYLTGRHHRTLVIFNLPDNATLQAQDSDGDGLSDYDELFVYYTDPFYADTSENGWDDGFLVANGFDPNNPFDKPNPDITLISPSNGSTVESVYVNLSVDIFTETGVRNAVVEVRSLADVLLYGEQQNFTGETNLTVVFESTVAYVGDVYWQVFVEDVLGAEEQSIRYYFTLDPPQGCTDPAAFNYNESAEYDDGSCIEVVLGCTDLVAVNYDETANTDDGTCYYNPGCTDLVAVNYDGFADFDDGTCYYNPGCTDPIAFNYDGLADFDDGTCYYNPGCTDPMMDNYDETADFDDGTCFRMGCTDPVANNHDPIATVDDGGCIYQVDPIIELSFDKTSPQTYGLTITVNCSTDSDGVITLLRGGLDVTAELGVPVILNAGLHEYECAVSETLDFYAGSVNQNFTITKATPVLELSSNLGWTIGLGEIVTITGSGCPSGVSCQLYRQSSPVGNPNVVSLGAGSYTYVYNTSGNSNYDSATTSRVLEVEPGIGSVLLLINGADTENLQFVYGTQINISAVSGVGQTISVFLNGVNITSLNGEFLSLNASHYEVEITAHANDDYLENNVARNFTVVKATPGLILSGVPSQSIFVNTEVILEGEGCPSQLVCVLSVDEENVTNPYTFIPEQGSYAVFFETLGNNNYDAFNVSGSFDVLRLPVGGGSSDLSGAREATVLGEETSEVKETKYFMGLPVPTSEQTVILGAILVMIYLVFSNGMIPGLASKSAVKNTRRFKLR